MTDLQWALGIAVDVIHAEMEKFAFYANSALNGFTDKKTVEGAERYKELARAAVILEDRKRQKELF